MLWIVGYNLIGLFALVLLSPFWLTWLALVPKTRAGFFQKLGFYPKPFLNRLESLPSQKRIWVHTVSVGEFNAARPLINRLIEAEYSVLVSTTTATGQALAQKTYPNLPICYFPLDLPWVIHGTLKRLDPEVVVILETEIWPNLLNQASGQNIPVVMVNGRLSAKSSKGYARFKPFFPLGSQSL